MKALLAALLTLLFAFPALAQSGGCVVPYVFFNNTQLIDANQMNANFASLVNCVNAIPQPSLSVTNITSMGAQPTASPGFQATPVDPAGTFDNTAAINKAIATGNSVYIPPGYWHVKGQISCPGYGQIIFGAGQGQSIIDVGSDFNMSATSVVNQGNASVQVTRGCVLMDFGINFYQNPADTNRSQLIEYPPAVASSASRNVVGNMTISRGWSCFNYAGNFTFTFVGSIESGCFHQNLFADGQLDYSFIHSMEVWPFGSGDIPAGGGANLVGIWKDGTTQAAFLGRIDGLEVNNLSTFSASVVVGTDEVTATGINFGVLHMDSLSGLTVKSGTVSIGTFAGADDNGASAIPALVVAEPAGGTLTHVTIGNLAYETNDSVGGLIAVHGGQLIINGGHFFNNADATNIVCDGSTNTGYLLLNNLYIAPPTNGVPLSNPVIAQLHTLGPCVLAATNLVFNDSNGNTGTMIQIGSDISDNLIAGNQYGGWGASSVVLSFLPLSSGGLGISGYYDLGGLTFPYTVTPEFTTEGDYAPSAVTCTGCVFRLNGSYATFDMNLQWTNNAYTTAMGTFEATTNLPRVFSATTAGYPFPLQQASGMSLGTSPQQFPLGVNLNGSSNFSFGLANSGVASSLANQTNFPASRSYQVVTGGRYLIRGP